MKKLEYISVLIKIRKLVLYYWLTIDVSIITSKLIPYLPCWNMNKSLLKIVELLTDELLYCIIKFKVSFWNCCSVC